MHFRVRKSKKVKRSGGQQQLKQLFVGIIIIDNEGGQVCDWF